MAIAMTLTVMSASVALATDPVCTAELGTATHGQHVVGDYVTGDGHEGPWPPNGLVGSGEAPADPGSGPVAALPGGGGPGFHFGAGVAPGASFCTDSNSFGAHPLFDD